MPTCPGCDGSFDPGALDRHERDGRVVVHCPDCDAVVGTWRDPASRPVRDHREDDLDG
jgi:hypothetical protein